MNPKTTKVYAVQMRKTAYGDYELTQGLQHWKQPEWNAYESGSAAQPLNIETEKLTMEPVGIYWMAYSQRANVLIVAKPT